MDHLQATILKGGKPVAIITLYGTNGKTIIKTHEMDLSGVAYDAISKKVNGSLQMQSKPGGNVLHANSQIQY